MYRFQDQNPKDRDFKRIETMTRVSVCSSVSVSQTSV